MKQVILSLILFLGISFFNTSAIADDSIALDNGCSFIFMPKKENRNEQELIFVKNSKIEKRHQVGCNLIYGSFKDNLVVIYGDKVKGNSGYQLHLISTLDGEIGFSYLIEGVNVYAYIDAILKTVCYVERENSLIFIGMDLKNKSQEEVAKTKLFKFNLTSKKIEIIDLPEKSAGYAISLNEELVGIYSTSGSLIIVNSKGMELGRQAIDFTKGISPNRVSYCNVPHVGLFAWTEGGIIRKVASSDYKIESAITDIKVFNNLLFLSHYQYKSKDVLLCGYGKEGEKGISKLSILDPISSKVIWEKTFDQKFCTMAIALDKKSIELIDQETGQFSRYHVEEDKMNSVLLLEINKSDLPVLFQCK